MSWWSWRAGEAGVETDTKSDLPLAAESALGRKIPTQPGPTAAEVVTAAGTPGTTAPVGKAAAAAAALPVAGAVAVDEAPAVGGATESVVTVAPVSLQRIGTALDKLDIRFLNDGGGSLLAMWERHAVLFTIEGPDDEILVIRARPHMTVPPDWADRAYRVVNEWNHTRRFCKAYIGDPTERNQLPIYAELQVPLTAGVHDELLVELIDCAAAVATSFVDWLHDEGALL